MLTSLVYMEGGITPTADERLAAIAEFGSATAASDAGARGRPLLDVTQNTTFQARELNAICVQMQFFGLPEKEPE
jgi:hypothetical protein